MEMGSGKPAVRLDGGSGGSLDGMGGGMPARSGSCADVGAGIGICAVVTAGAMSIGGPACAIGGGVTGVMKTAGGGGRGVIACCTAMGGGTKDATGVQAPGGSIADVGGA
mmetsp:Transcript_57683/g.154517  ORF Transcript_57683/g.154517 Transcript_57683/m.154517 type:complete len:110 (+) Transcript_57683:939-1268(+)